MDGQISNPQRSTEESPLVKPVEEIPVNQPQQNLSNLPEEKHSPILLFEIALVIIVLILFFVTLNYFNILRLSEMFPNQLGFLPHQKQNKSNLTMKQFNNVNVTIAPTISPSISLLEQAKQTLVDFLPTILNPSLLPSSSDISLTQNKGLVESFSSSWSIQEGTLSAILVVSPNSKNIVQLYLSLMQAENVPPSVKLASTITSNLFSIKQKGKWG